ncbi:hypothetical protein ACIGW3_06815 [Streptomyces sp. NPDC053499]|uniref:hypothetical protein n=1 Tax=Streptomyces sp. NPDC053499 TaxID=3365707 RepID=UPI0037D3D153
MRSRLITVATAIVCTVLGATAPASARDATSTPRSAPAADLPGPIEGQFDLSGFDPEPWRPFRPGDITLPGGVYCPFDLHLHLVEDEEMTRVDSRYPDGSVHINEYKGKLVVDFTNTDSGVTVRRDLSGRGAEELRPDGTRKTLGGVGPFGVGFKNTDAYPAGYYVVDGIHVTTWDTAGRRHMAVAIGSQENICRTLA